MRTFWKLLLFVAVGQTANQKLFTSAQASDGNNAVIDISVDNNIFANSSRECGKAVLNAEIGSIQYKVTEALEANERCVWVIRVHNATGYSVGVFSLGFPEPNVDHQLTITTFHGNSDPETTTPDHLGMYHFNEANALLITFHTGNTSNVSHTGFMLEYGTYHVEGTSIINQYFDFFFNATEEQNMYRAPSSPTDGITLGFYIWNWGDSVHKPEQMMKMVFARGDGWAFDAAQRMEIYSYDPLSNWRFIDLVDANTNLLRVIQSRDLLLFAYRISGTTSATTYFELVNFNCKIG